VKQTCEGSRGENRRSREERQGRNEHGDWQPRAEGWETIREWTRDSDAGGEEIFGKPQERSFALKPSATEAEETGKPSVTKVEGSRKSAKKKTRSEAARIEMCL